MFDLKIKGRYIYNNNEPFYILGDTAWLILQKLNMEEIKRYLKNRKSLGFNYIQFVLIYSDSLNHDINEMKHNYIDPNDRAFWTKALELVKLCNELDIIAGILPCWGAVVKDGFINIENAKQYGNFLVHFFKDYTNIIWVLGGDVRPDGFLDVYNILGNTLKESGRLVTFHPFGRTGSYLWFNDEPWLDFNMYQSGHRRYDQLNLNAWDDRYSLNEDAFGEDSYKYVRKGLSYKNQKPILDAEPSYEGIVQGLHDPKEPYWEARHIRRYAYWSVFEGACGFIYGNNAIIQFYNYDGFGSYGVRESWLEGLTSPGGAELLYLKKLTDKFDFTKGRSNPTLILNNKDKHHFSACYSSSDYILIYTYKGDKLEIDLSNYKTKKMDLYIMNPENNSKAYYDTIINQDKYVFRPTRRRELSNDWVLIFKESK